MTDRDREPLSIGQDDIQAAEEALGYPRADSPEEQHTINQQIVTTAAGLALQREEELFGTPTSGQDVNSEKDRK